MNFAFRLRIPKIDIGLVMIAAVFLYGVWILWRGASAPAEARPIETVMARHAECLRQAPRLQCDAAALQVGRELGVAEEVTARTGYGQ